MRLSACPTAFLNSVSRRILVTSLEKLISLEESRLTATKADKNFFSHPVRSFRLQVKPKICNSATTRLRVWQRRSEEDGFPPLVSRRPEVEAPHQKTQIQRQSAPRNLSAREAGNSETLKKGENLRRLQRVQDLMIILVQENIGSGTAGGSALRGNTASWEENERSKLNKKAFRRHFFQTLLRNC